MERYQTNTALSLQYEEVDSFGCQPLEFQTSDLSFDSCVAVRRKKIKWPRKVVKKMKNCEHHLEIVRSWTVEKANR